MPYQPITVVLAPDSKMAATSKKGAKSTRGKSTATARSPPGRPKKVTKEVVDDETPQDVVHEEWSEEKIPENTAENNDTGDT